VIHPIPGSRLVEITYTDNNPVRAQKIVMGFANQFIEANRDKKFEANAYAKTFLEDQLAQLKVRLQESESTLINFGQQEKIVGATDKTPIAESNLAAANTALGNLVADRIRNEQQYRQAENATAATLPQFLTNKTIEGLRDKRNALATDYQEKGQTLRADYPAMVQIANKIKETDRQINDEIKVIKSSLKGAYEASLKQEDEMKARIEALRGEVLDLQKRSIQFNILKREADSNRTLYEDLLQRYKEVDVAGGVGASNIFIVDRADVPTSPSSPNVTRDLALSFVVGLLTSLAGAFLLDRLDNTVTKLDEYERVTGLSTLGFVPEIASGLTLEDEMKDPRSRVWEAYRTLCGSLQFATHHGLPKSMTFTSSNPGEGKSTSCIAVARHFGNLGLRVLLVDCDLRVPSLHKKMGLENKRGLTNFLTGACTPAEAAQPSQFSNVSFVSSGPLPPNAAELLGSPKFPELMRMASAEFDLIILDGPPVMGLADAPMLSKATEATVFVTQAGRTAKHQIRAALKRMRASRCNVIGGLLTHYEAKNESQYYEYGYQYGDRGQISEAPKPGASAAKPGLLSGVKALMFR
jgi:capsular exopolysaccharide synthesis family protein